MADLDITKNNLSHETITVPNTGELDEAALFPVDVHADAQTIAGMSGVLVTAGYTLEQINKMTKNDMIYALRETNGLTYQPE